MQRGFASPLAVELPQIFDVMSNGSTTTIRANRSGRRHSRCRTLPYEERVHRRHSLGHRWTPPSGTKDELPRNGHIYERCGQSTARLTRQVFRTFALSHLMNNIPVILINVFTVDPTKQQELIELLAEATEDSVRHAAGFISAHLHRSLDGTKVTMYSQWRSEEDYQAMRKDPAPLPYLQQALAIATFEPGMYEVVGTFFPTNTTA